MAMFNYWDGTMLAKVSTSTVPSVFNQPRSVTFMNQVFTTWYRDMRKLKARNHRTAIKTLEDMGRTRGGFTAVNPMIGIKNLWDGFAHYDACGKAWKDTNSWSYNGGALTNGFVNNVPWAMCTFAGAYDANLKKIADYAEKHKREVQKIRGALEGKNYVPWNLINEPLKMIDEYTKAVDPLLVMCPESKLKRGYDWTKNAATFSGALDDIMKETAASGNAGQASAVVALGVIVSKCVPIFGDLYAEAIKGLPNAIRFFEEIKWQRNHEMAKIFGSKFRMYD
jgi:hypothetical protein